MMLRVSEGADGVVTAVGDRYPSGGLITHTCRFRFPMANRYRREHSLPHFSALLGGAAFTVFRGESENRAVVQVCYLGQNSEPSDFHSSALGLSRTGLRVGRVTSTYSSRTLDRLREHREAIRNVLARYGASNPRLFGSIAQGTAGPDSDVDLLLDLAAEGSGSRLSRLSGIRLELEELLKLPVDVVCEELLKEPVSESARRQAIAL